ncbi:hypothetical protein [Streptomyces sp. NBC_01198]|uniref:hypothetical protein n=1 Tax=Streptomyces sp. NBC_01198 TaxID=2903769 RepID=UPI002E0EE8C3|nr:hypothetical protein OG702_32215 [Streptomyces sp. NBC_01198]
MYIIETVKDDGKVRVRIVIDPAPSNPRGAAGALDCHALTIDTHMGHYVEVDPTGGPLEEGWSRISWRAKDAVDIFERWARIYHGAVTHFSHKIDGAVVIWYSLPSYWRHQEYDRETVRNYLIRTDDEYRAWASGEVYAVVKERLVIWVNEETGEERQEWTPVHSVRDIYSLDSARSLAKYSDTWQ